MSLTTTMVLARRALRESWRMPEALFPMIFIPLFFLVVNLGQMARIFPSSTPFLRGQSYAAFQMPNTLLLAASFGSAALFLVEEVEGGYFDKLRATPVARMSLVTGRLVSEAVKSVIISSLILLASLLFGLHVGAGVVGFVLIVLLAAMWAVVYSGFLQLVALKSRSAAATNSAGMVFFPLLFLTPNVVPLDKLTHPMRVAASANPVTYMMQAQRSLMLDSLHWDKVWPGFAVLVAAGVVMLAFSVRVVRNYD
jgi:ABC-2 type transport system permease protein